MYQNLRLINFSISNTHLSNFASESLNLSKLAGQSIALNTDFIRSHRSKEEWKTVLLHKLYQKTYIETLMKSLVHD